MEMVLILYAICASALVTWSTLPGDDDLRRTGSHAAVEKQDQLRCRLKSGAVLFPQPIKQGVRGKRQSEHI